MFFCTTKNAFPFIVYLFVQLLVVPFQFWLSHEFRQPRPALKAIMEFMDSCQGSLTLYGSKCWESILFLLEDMRGKKAISRLLIIAILFITLFHLQPIIESNTKGLLDNKRTYLVNPQQ
jgi:hypothetical protein